MKNYKFNVRKILESDVEIKAKNKKEAIKKLLAFVSSGDEKFCEKIFYERTKHKIKLKEIDSRKNKINFDDDNKINKEVMKFLLTRNEEKNVEESEKKYKRISYKQYENYMQLEEYIHHLKS